MNTRLSKIRASVDANAVIHFYRADLAAEPGYVIDGLLDPFILKEIQNHAKDVHAQLARDLAKEAYWLRLIERNDLNATQKSLYDRSYNDNRLMFDPKDWGEAAAIALGHAMGAAVLLTDDTKKSGPRDYIIKGAIEAIDTIAFWEVLLLLYAAGRLSPEGLAAAFNRIKSEGYDTPPKVNLQTGMVASINRLMDSEWFMKWVRANAFITAPFEELKASLRG